MTEVERERVPVTRYFGEVALLFDDGMENFASSAQYEDVFV